MEPFKGQFTLPHLERVIAGAGSLATLPGELDRYGRGRAVVVTGRTVGASPLASRVRALLGDRCVQLFADARQHVPAGTVRALLQAIRDADADCLVSVGGGSSIDTAKAAVHALPGDAGGDRPALLHVAVPTTLSAGEFTDVAGMTDEHTRIKHALFDARLAPRTVIADPELAADTPRWLWAASGVRAVDHAVETLYAARRHPLSEAAAERGLRMLVDHLPPSLDGPAADRLAHRGECQMGAWLAVFGVTNAGFGLSHVLGHQIGPRWNVAHGVTSAVVLPHAMRFMARVAAGRFAGIARALGIAFDPAAPAAGAAACVEVIDRFIDGLDLPRRLRDVGVDRDELGGVASTVAGLIDRAGAAPRSVTATDLSVILDAAF